MDGMPVGVRRSVQVDAVPKLSERNTQTDNLHALMGTLVYCRDCEYFVGYVVKDNQIMCTRSHHPVIIFR